jgi:hypothetical protein
VLASRSAGTRVIAAYAASAWSRCRRRIGGLPKLCEYVAGSSEDADHVSVGAFSGTGIGVEALELAGRREIASPAEVGERRRERPVVRVAAPDRIERGAGSVASGERHAVVDVFDVGPNAMGALEVLAWQGPPKAEIACNPNGALELEAVTIAAMQLIELPRTLDVGVEPDDGPEPQLRAMFQRIRAALMAWMQALDHLKK